MISPFPSFFLEPYTARPYKLDYASTRTLNRQTDFNFLSLNAASSGAICFLQELDISMKMPIIQMEGIHTVVISMNIDYSTFINEGNGKPVKRKRRPF